MRALLFLILLSSCGGGSGSKSETPSGIATQVDGNTFSMSIAFDDMEGAARWTVELMDGDISLGVCEFESKPKKDQSSMYFKNTSGDPICHQVVIDPISTINNLVIHSEFSSVKYCVYQDENKKCGELHK